MGLGRGIGALGANVAAGFTGFFVRIMSGTSSIMAGATLDNDYVERRCVTNSSVLLDQ
jgi:hypothetical protein